MSLPHKVTDNGPIDRNFRSLDNRTTTIEPATAVAPTLATGWSNSGGAYQTASYYKGNRRVYLSGSVTNGGTGTGLITTLPSSYRPAATLTFNVPILGGTGQVSIDNTGAVTDLTFSVASKAFLSLDAINFLAA